MATEPTQQQLRQHYLDAMGITSWLPVKVLPAAAPSPTWRWLDENDLAELRSVAQQPAEPAVCTTEPQAVAEPIVRAEAQQAAVEAETRQERPAVSESSVAETAVSSEPKTFAPPPRFRLAMLAYGDALVICQMPLDVLQSFPPEHQRLVQRILQSVGLGQGDMRQQMFAWPIVNNPNVDQSLPLAQAAVSSLVTRFHAEQLPLLLFGQQLPEYLGLDETLLQQPQKLGERPVIVAPTLNELIAIPGLKRELWVQLQSFQPLL